MLFASWCVWSSWLLGILSYVLKRCLILNLGYTNVQVRIIWIIMYSLSLRSSPLSIFQDEKLLIWYAGKEEKQLKLSHVSRIIPGQRTVSFCVPSNEMKKISFFFYEGPIVLQASSSSSSSFVWFIFKTYSNGSFISVFLVIIFPWRFFISGSIWFVFSSKPYWFCCMHLLYLQPIDWTLKEEPWFSFALFVFQQSIIIPVHFQLKLQWLT